MRFVFGLMDDEGLNKLEKALAIEDDDDFWDSGSEEAHKYLMEIGVGLPFAFENTYYKLRDSKEYPERKKLESAFKGLNSGDDLHDGTGRLGEAFKKNPERFMHEGDFIICYLDKDESKELVEFLSYLMRNGFGGFFQASESSQDWFLVKLPSADDANYDEEFKKRNSFLKKAGNDIGKAQKIESYDWEGFEEFIKNYQDGDNIFGYLD